MFDIPIQISNKFSVIFLHNKLSLTMNFKRFKVLLHFFYSFTRPVLFHKTIFFFTKCFSKNLISIIIGQLITYTKLSATGDLFWHNKFFLEYKLVNIENLIIKVEVSYLISFVENEFKDFYTQDSKYRN